MADNRSGRTLGSYQLLERIGVGGMGVVYRAVHQRLGRQAAVKVLPETLAADPNFLKRFEREAANVASLQHNNILAVWDYGDEGGTPYLVMPYITGGTLRDRLNDGPVPPQRALGYLRQIADALDYAHAQGIIHRDVKPANLMLDDRDQIYLGDFGIAKALEGAEGLTRTGVGVGTPEYMAPEQAQGRADSRSDLYALGVILYQMLTGRVPYSGNSTVEVLMKHLQDPLPMLPLRAVQPALSPRVEQIIQKALAKNPNDRYGSGRAMVEDFTEALAAGPGQSTGTGAAAAGFGGAATVVSNTPLPGNQPPQFGGATQGGGMGMTPPMGSTPLPLGMPPQGSNTPPPYGMNQPQGFGAPQYGGQTPPPPGGMPPGGGTPPPVYAPQGPRPNQPAKSGSNRGLLIGGIAAAVLVLLLICGGAAVALSRGGATPTATVNAGATTIAAQNLKATQTAGAPKPSASASSSAAASAPASASSAASAPASASASASASSAPSASASAVPSASAAPSPSASAAPSASASASARPSASASASSAPSASASARPSASASAATAAKPRNTAPSGWKTYSGTARVPFAMYYPPNWTVDESRASEGRIYFYGPGVTSPTADGTWVLIATTGIRDPNANVDVLRDQYFKEQILSDYPDAKVDIGRNDNKWSGITWYDIGTQFVDSGTTCYAYIGLGLNNQVPWRYRLNSLYDDYDSNISDYFYDMINSLNIYANP